MMYSPTPPKNSVPKEEFSDNRSAAPSPEPSEDRAAAPSFEIEKSFAFRKAMKPEPVPEAPSPQTPSAANTQADPAISPLPRQGSSSRETGEQGKSLVRVSVPDPRGPYDDPDALEKIILGSLADADADFVSEQETFVSVMWKGSVIRERHTIVEISVDERRVDQVLGVVRNFHPDRNPKIDILSCAFPSFSRRGAE